ncbi:unnamed protein product, partial [Ixodes pacificus]
RQARSGRRLAPVAAAASCTARAAAPAAPAASLRSAAPRQRRIGDHGDPLRAPGGTARPAGLRGTTRRRRVPALVKSTRCHNRRRARRRAASASSMPSNDFSASRAARRRRSYCSRGRARAPSCDVCNWTCRLSPYSRRVISPPGATGRPASRWLSWSDRVHGPACLSLEAKFRGTRNQRCSS